MLIRVELDDCGFVRGNHVLSLVICQVSLLPAESAEIHAQQLWQR